MATLIGIVLAIIGLGFFGVEVYHLVKDIKARKNKKIDKEE